MLTSKNYARQPMFVITSWSRMVVILTDGGKRGTWTNLFEGKWTNTLNVPHGREIDREMFAIGKPATEEPRL
jgi:hypothetical protein